VLDVTIGFLKKAEAPRKLPGSKIQVRDYREVHTESKHLRSIVARQIEDYRKAFNRQDWMYATLADLNTNFDYYNIMGFLVAAAYESAKRKPTSVSRLGESFRLGGPQFLSGNRLAC